VSLPSADLESGSSRKISGQDRMGSLNATDPEELIATFRELFPQEFQIAFLTLSTRKQAERIAELEAEAESRSSSRPHGDYRRSERAPGSRLEDSPHHQSSRMQPTY
jgi:hypothetical protein